MALTDNISSRPRNQRARQETAAVLELAQVAHEHVEETRHERDQAMMQSLPRVAAPHKQKPRKPSLQSARDQRGQEKSMKDNKDQNRVDRRGDERRASDRTERRDLRNNNNNQRRDSRDFRNSPITQDVRNQDVWVQDGVDHINIWTRGATEIGQVLDMDFEMPWVHPRYGRFLSLSSFWYYVTSHDLDRGLMMLPSHVLRKRGSTQNHQATRKTVDNLRALMIDAAYHRIISVPEVAESLRETNLPLDNYVVVARSTPPQRHPRGLAFWFVPGMEYIRRALKTGEGIRADGSLDVTVFMDNRELDLFSGVGEEKPAATGAGLLGKLMGSSNPPTRHMLRGTVLDEQPEAKPRPAKPVQTRATKKVVSAPQPPKEPKKTPAGDAHQAPESDFPRPDEQFTYRLSFKEKHRRDSTLFSLADVVIRDSVLTALLHSDKPQEAAASTLGLLSVDRSDDDDGFDLWLTVQMFGEKTILAAATTSTMSHSPYANLLIRGEGVKAETPDVQEGDEVIDAAVIQATPEMLVAGLENIRLFKRSNLRSRVVVSGDSVTLLYSAAPEKAVESAADALATSLGQATDVEAVTLDLLEPVGEGVDETAALPDNTAPGEALMIPGFSQEEVSTAQEAEVPAIGADVAVQLTDEPTVTEDGVQTSAPEAARTDERDDGPADNERFALAP